MKASELGDGFARDPKPNPYEIIDRVFKPHGESQYTLDLLPAGIGFMVTRIHRAHKETLGELTITVGGNFSKAKHTRGIVSKGNFNFSSIQTRSTLGKALKERTGVDLDWEGLLTEFAIQVLEAERQGQPAVRLADYPYQPEESLTWDLLGLPILQNLPMVVYGDGGSMKSYLSMWVAGTLAAQDIPVLYCDWEYDVRPHYERFNRLFKPKPQALYYVRCNKPLRDEQERLSKMVLEHGIRYVICDSIMFALDGKADEEQAGIYFRAVRQLGNVGSLHVAHTQKNEGETEKSVYGSIFFQNGARSIWHTHKATEHPPGEEYMGLFHRKANEGSLLKPKGLKYTFRGDRVLVESLDVSNVDELAARFPLLDRIKKLLSVGAMLPKDIAAKLGITVQTVQQVAARHGSQFVYLGPKVALRSNDVDF